MQNTSTQDLITSLRSSRPMVNLRRHAQSYGEQVNLLASVVLDDPRFPIWSGSSFHTVHHYGPGQLAIHTEEVVTLSLLNNTHFNQLGKGVKDDELFLAALFHDIGKTYDYEPVPPYTKEDGSKVEEYQEWRSTSHKTNIYHISRSGLIWSKAFDKFTPTLPTEFHDNVLHAILAHHGRLEWKSPVTPKSRLAWILHLSDCMSARIDDCEKKTNEPGLLHKAL